MARPPFTFERNTLGSNGSFALRFIAGPPFAGVHLKNARHITASLQEPRIKNACCSAAPLTKGLTGRPTVNRPFVVCRRCPPVAAQNSKSSISRENFLFFEKFSLLSANVEPEAALE